MPKAVCQQHGKLFEGKAKKAIREYKKRLGRHKQLLCRFVYGYLKTTETVFDDHKKLRSYHNQTMFAGIKTESAAN